MNRRIAVILVLICLCLCGCTKFEKKGNPDVSRFVQVESTGYRWVVYDRYTKVMYVGKAHCFEPLYNADGSLLLWDGE